MADQKKTITNALQKLSVNDAKDRLARIDKWTREAPIAIAMLPSLVGAVTTRYTDSGATLTKGRVKLEVLTENLKTVHDRTYGKHWPDAVFKTVPPTISQYVTNGIQPAAPIATLYLLWLSEEMAAKRVSVSSRVYNILSIFNFVKAVEDCVFHNARMPLLANGTIEQPLLAEHQIAVSAAEEQIAQDERIASGSIGRLMGGIALAPEEIHNDFFHEDPSKACFALYRRATSNNDIIKGFLVVQPPKSAGEDAYSFHHYYADGSGNQRETRGFLLSLSGRYYFIGATGNRKPPRKGQKLSRPLLKEGMKFLVVDRKLQANQGAMWGGLFLSHDRSYTPIAGRCVLIRSKFEHSDQAGLGVVDDLRADIEKCCDTGAASLKEQIKRIELAIDNSYEPSRTTGGDDRLMGPLTIVHPVA